MRTFKTTTSIAILSFVFCGCSEKQEEAEVTIQEERKSNRTILITVEGKKDVAIDDPYIDEIQSLSSAFEVRRSHYINEHKSMSPEERKAYGEFRDQTAERMRELQKSRKIYIREKMKEFDGVSFQLEEGDLKQAVESASDYLDKSQ